MLKAIWNFLFPVKGDQALKYTDRTAMVPEAPYKIEPPVQTTTKIDGIGHESVQVTSVTVQEEVKPVEKPKKSGVKNETVKKPKKIADKKNSSEKLAKATTPRKTTKKAK